MERSGFFDAHYDGSNYDRTYLAEFFALYFGSLVGNGVFTGATKLKVVADAEFGMRVYVKEGLGWINGYLYQNTDDAYFTVPTAHGVYNRIDRIVLRWGVAERAINLTYLTGSASSDPEPPAIRRDADYYDLCLADISVTAGLTNILQANITDKRPDNTVCGFVQGLIDQIDTTDLFDQFTSAFDNWYDASTSTFNIWYAEKTEGFDEWFETMKGQLSTDAAGNLQLEINYVNANVLVVIPSESWESVQIGGLYYYKATVDEGTLVDGTSIDSLVSYYEQAANKLYGVEDVSEVHPMLCMDPDADTFYSTLEDKKLYTKFYGYISTSLENEVTDDGFECYILQGEEEVESKLPTIDINLVLKGA